MLCPSELNSWSITALFTYVLYVITDQYKHSFNCYANIKQSTLAEIGQGGKCWMNLRINKSIRFPRPS